jgi:nitroimidazol reductase NimA-like FMN-containing flavoprotein (pyridoxamine 5'-phosphate oxidase superfamily)
VSVVVFGRYRELPNTPEYEDKRRHVWSLLQRRPIWWEPAYVKTILDAEERPLAPLFFQINIERITGHRAHQGPFVF